MSIVFVSSPQETFTPTHSGALATIIYESCRAAQREGTQPYVVTRSCEHPPFTWQNTVFVDYPHLPESGALWYLARLERKLLGWQHPGHRTFALRMAHAIARHNLQQYPLVVLNNPETAILLRRKFPHAFIAHWFQNQLECKPRVRAQLKDAVNAAFGVSNFTARWIEEYYGFPGGSVATLYNATDCAHFSPPETQSQQPPAVPVINFVGRTGREKAPDLLLRAALQLAENGHRFTLQIVGSNHWGHFELDDYQRELQELATRLKEHGIEVRFTGHVSRANLPEVLRNAHINVVPSRWDEPFGMVTLEGMACGLATVASNTGGTPEVVGNAALLFERDNVTELAGRLRLLLENETLRLEYSRKGVARAREFSWSRLWQQLQVLTHTQ